MNEDDLLKMLDIAPKKASPVSDKSDLKIELDLDPPDDDRGLVLSDTVLSCDIWDRAQGLTIAQKKGISEDAATDFFAAAYHIDPQVTGLCPDRNRQSFIETMLELPDYQVLHQSTRSNVLASQMAAVEFAEKFKKAFPDPEPKADEDGVSPPPKAQRSEDEIETLFAVSAAVSAAQQHVDDLNDFARAMGTGPGGPAERLDVEELTKQFNRVKHNEALRRIMELAGRYRMSAQAKQRDKSTHGYDEMIGVEMSGEVSRILPLELAMLADEDFELDAMRRLVERQMMSRQYQGVEKKGKGPIVVCVDESGSMSGEPIANAKAFALAMAWVARHQNRHCVLVGYSGGTEGNVLVLPPSKWKAEPAELIDWLLHFYRGGTDMDVPLDVVPRMWEAGALQVPQGKTDLILITDAIAYVPFRIEQAFLEWKKRAQARCISLVIGADGRSLKKVSDEVHMMSNLDVRNDGIQSCLSI